MLSKFVRFSPREIVIFDGDNFYSEPERVEAVQKYNLIPSSMIETKKFLK